MKQSIINEQKNKTTNNSSLKNSAQWAICLGKFFRLLILCKNSYSRFSCIKPKLPLWLAGKYMVSQMRYVNGAWNSKLFDSRRYGSQCIPFDWMHQNGGQRTQFQRNFDGFIDQMYPPPILIGESNLITHYWNFFIILVELRLWNH